MLRVCVLNCCSLCRCPCCRCLCAIRTNKLIGSFRKLSPITNTHTRLVCRPDQVFCCVCRFGRAMLRLECFLARLDFVRAAKCNDGKLTYRHIDTATTTNDTCNLRYCTVIIGIITARYKTCRTRACDSGCVLHFRPIAIIVSGVRYGFRYLNWCL